MALSRRQSVLCRTADRTDHTLPITSQSPDLQPTALLRDAYLRMLRKGPGGEVGERCRELVRKCHEQGNGD